MDSKQAALMASVFLSCYLVLSLVPVYAYSMGEILPETTRAGLVTGPLLEIVAPPGPIDCGSEGVAGLRAYVKNVPKFDIEKAEAWILEKGKGTEYDISSAFSCTPDENVLANQEILCMIDVREMLSELPECPLEKSEETLSLSLGISYLGTDKTVSGETGIVITEAGVVPDMEVDFDVSYPSYPVPRLNCLTGSEVDVPVVIRHAEALPGEITWSFSLNGTSMGSSMIECEKAADFEGEGREDVYECEITVPKNAYAECREGSGVLVEVFATSGSREMSGNFTTVTVSEELDLGLSVSGLDTLNCQIINQSGLCVPLRPQQNVTVSITGNVPSNLKVFESRYRLGEGGITTLYCRKTGSAEYECSTFITMDTLPFPGTDGGTTSKSRDMTVYFDVKYLDHYTNVSDTIEVEMEGFLIQELVNTLKVMEMDREIFGWLKNVTESSLFTEAWDIGNRLRKCCDRGGIIGSFAKEAAEEGIKEAFEGLFNRLVREYVWDSGAAVVSNIMRIINALYSVVVGNGPKIIGCIAEKSMEDIDEEMEKLQDYEDGRTIGPSELELPEDTWEMIEDHYLECRLDVKWPEFTWKDILTWLCTLLVAIATASSVGAVGSVCSTFSTVWSNIDNVIASLTILVLAEELNVELKDMALAREKIKLEQKIAQIMADYSAYFAGMMESLVSGMITNAGLNNMTSTDYDEVKLIFLSNRLGVLGSGDEICVDDEITIEYNFEKLAQSEDFSSSLHISSPTNSKTLYFDDVKGTYPPRPPILTQELLGADTSINDGDGVDPSETYTFTLYYESSRYDFGLYYVNHPCEGF